MKKQTFYESEDGQIFDNEEDCQLWEKVAPRLKKLGTTRLNFQYLFDDDTNTQCPEWIKSISLLIKAIRTPEVPKSIPITKCSLFICNDNF